MYIDTADSNKLKLADANGTSTVAADIRTPVGIALHAAAAGQPLTYHYEGQLAVGGTLSAGFVYVCSATPGGIAPVGDATTGWYTATLGIALTAAILDVKIHAGLTVRA